MSSREKKHASVGCIVLSIFCIAILATLFAVIFYSQKYESRLELDGTAGDLIPIYRYNHEKSALEELTKLPVGTECEFIEDIGISYRYGGTIRTSTWSRVECNGVKGYVQPDSLKTKFYKK